MWIPMATGLSGVGLLSVTLVKQSLFTYLFIHLFIKNLLYQENSPWVIISLTLMTSGVEKALILQGEV